MAWAKMAVRHMGVDEFKDENGNRGRCRRDDVAVDVMTIVESVLWGGPASSVPWFTLGERRL